MTNLQYLYLNGNNLSGTISSLIGNMKNLTFLTVNENRLTGSIPKELSQLSSLLVGWFHLNALNGTMPDVCGFNNLWWLKADCGEDDDTAALVSCDCCTACCVPQAVDQPWSPDTQCYETCSRLRRVIR